MPMEDCEVIKAFIVHLRGHGYPCLQVDEWPDKVNRNSLEIDAIAGPLAIEHTSIDALLDQRGVSKWFMQAVGGIEQELHEKVSFRLRITIEYDAIKKGQKWFSIRQALKNWITTEASRLAEGHHVLDGIKGVPFRLHITKASDRHTGIFFCRLVPPDDTTFSARIKEQFDGKAEKLVKYKTGKTTVLLIENNDYVLMNVSMIQDVIQKAYPKGLPYGVDQIWYADTSIPSEIEFSILQGQPVDI